MRFHLSATFSRAYTKAPSNIQIAFEKQLLLLLQNIRHPSLHAKKYNEVQNIWQARVNKNWRFYFKIQNDIYVIYDIMKHPK